MVKLARFPKTMTRQLLQRIAIALLVLTCAASSLLYMRSTAGMERGSEALQGWEDRLAPARAALPVKRGLVGYLSEWDVPGAEYGVWDQESEYLLAQYALAPLILVKGGSQEWNVAVLSRESLEAWQAAYPGAYEVIRLEHGVYLLHKLNSP